MTNYETLVLSVPEITANETSTIEGQFAKLIKKNEGKLTSFERWGKYKLAYPVEGNDYGVYFLIRFEADKKGFKDFAKEIDDFFKLKLSNVVMRYMNTSLDPKRPLTYQKPDSLEDIPSQDVDTFLRENKMEGLIKPNSSSEAAVSEKIAAETNENVEQSDSEQKD